MSIFENRAFSDYWDKRAGENGEPLKQLVLDPLMFQIAGDIRDKTVLEVGPGNAYLLKEFFNRGAREVLLLDISDENLLKARQRAQSLGVSGVSYYHCDAQYPWKMIGDDIADLVTSNTVFNEVPNISTPFSEGYRILKKGGRFSFSVTHPGWDLFIRAQELVGVNSGKIEGLRDYFDEGVAFFLMGEDSKRNPNLGHSTGIFKVEHYQRMVSTYITTFLNSGFKLTHFEEPKLNDDLLSKYPRFEKYRHHPIFLVISGVKD